MSTTRPGDDPTPRAGEGGAYRKTPTQLATDPAFTNTYAGLPVRPGGYTSTNPPTRRAAANLSLSMDTNSSITSAVWRLPLRLPVASTRWRLHVANIDGRSQTLRAGAVTFQPVYVGQQAMDATGNQTGNFTAAPGQALAGFTTPADGSEYVSAWVTDSTLQIAADTPWMVSLGWTCTASQVNTRGTAWGFWANGTPTNVGQQNLTGVASINVCIYDIWIEYEFVGSNPVVLHLGDSLSAGYGSARPIYDSHGNQHAAASGAIPVNLGLVGALASEWLTTTDYKYTRLAGLNIDAFSLMIGTNDNNSSVAVATIEANIATIIANIKTATTAKRGFLGTLPPRNYSAGTPETNRGTLNTWLRTLPSNVLGCADYDRAVRDPSTVANIHADYDQGDHTHMNTAGYGAMARALPGRLVTSPF